MIQDNIVNLVSFGIKNIADRVQVAVPALIADANADVLDQNVVGRGRNTEIFESNPGRRRGLARDGYIRVGNSNISRESNCPRYFKYHNAGSRSFKRRPQ